MYFGKTADSIEPVCGGGSGGPKEPCVRWEFRSLHGKGQILAEMGRRNVICKDNVSSCLMYGKVCKKLYKYILLSAFVVSVGYGLPLSPAGKYTNPCMR